MSGNNNVKVSVIIPAYNVVEYITDTIRSVTQSTMNGIEIIVIDDYSMDGTYEILQKLAEIHSMIVLVRNPQNNGVAAARNKGLEIARGEYVFFLDGDDLIEPAALGKMYVSAIRTQADIVTGTYNNLTSHGNAVAELFIKYPTLSVGGTKRITDYPEFFNFFFCWGKLYKRELINKVRFNERIAIGEDIPIAIYTYINSKSIYTLPETVYFYRSRDGVSRSLTQSMSPDITLQNSLMMWSDIQSFFAELDEEEKDQLETYFTNMFIFDEWVHLSRAILSDHKAVRFAGLNAFDSWVTSLDITLFLKCINNLYNVMYYIDRMLDVLDEETRQRCLRLINTIKNKLNQCPVPEEDTNSQQFSLKDNVTIRVFKDDFIGRIIGENRDYYEREDLDKFLKHIPEASVIYDIGANIGNHSLYFSKYAKPQKIYAFEPIKEVKELLAANLRDNQFFNVEIIEAAVSDINTQGEMSIFDGNIGASHLLYSETGATTVVKIDDLNLLPPQFVKIDVDNLELEVINGMKQTLLDHRPILWLEIRDSSLVRVNRLLNQLNYEIVDRALSGFDYSNYIYAPKNL
ncbi:FkbM family methyltransferase [Paenibacillus haidiansis]